MFNLSLYTWLFLPENSVISLIFYPIVQLIRKFNQIRIKHSKSQEVIKNCIINTTLSSLRIIYNFSTEIIIIMFFYFIFVHQKMVESSFASKYINYKPNIFRIMDFSKNKEIFTILTCKNENIDLGRSYAEESINISMCFFSRLNCYQDYGGVIYVNCPSQSMNVSNSMFYNCSSVNQGGAIWFSSTNSILKMLCVHGCSSQRYLFSMILCVNINEIDFLSVSSCSLSSGLITMWLECGNQKMGNSNNSMNYVHEYSGVIINSPNSFASNYCTFSNNHVEHYICIYFYRNTGTMSFSNIVHNNSPVLGVVYLENGGSYKMMNCIFDMNQNCLFYTVSSNLEIYHSFINQIGITSSNNNNSLMKFGTYHISFYSSHYCHSDNIKQFRTYSSRIDFVNKLFIVFEIYVLL